MADVLLIQPKTAEHEIAYAPLGLLSLAAVVEREFSVRIVDTRFEREPATILSELKKRPLLVGISSITGEQINYGLEISKLIKEHSPETPVVWGGVHPTFFPKQAVAHPLVDFVIMNEGEIPLLQLARHFANRGTPALESIPSLCYQRDGQFVTNPAQESMDLDTLPQSPWHLVDVPRIMRGLSMEYTDHPIDISTSRGCPFRCQFCYELVWSNRTWRARSAGRVIDEINMLSDRFGVNHIIFHDDLFIVNRQSKERALEIAKGINSGGRRVKWTMTYRVDQLCADPDYAEKLTEYGFWQMRAGVESGSPRILKAIKKDITVEQILKSAQLAKDRGFHIRYSFVIGWPGETDQDRQQTIDLCFRLFDINPAVTIYPLWNYIPYPGTPHFDEAIAAGFKSPETLGEWGGYSWAKAHSPWIDSRAKFENIHTLSKFAFFNRDSAEVLKGLLSADLRWRTKGRRLGGMALRSWARYRLKNSSRSMPVPYEYRLIEPMLAGRS